MSEPRAAYQATDAELAEYGPRVLAIVRRHVGRANAIKARDIALELGWGGKYDDRRVRMIIRRLVIEQRQNIGSADDKPAGSWWIDSPDEVRSYLADLKARNLGIWERYQAAQRNAFIAFGIAPEQLQFDF